MWPPPDSAPSGNAACGPLPPEAGASSVVALGASALSAIPSRTAQRRSRETPRTERRMGCPSSWPRSRRRVQESGRFPPKNPLREWPLTERMPARSRKNPLNNARRRFSGVFPRKSCTPLPNEHSLRKRQCTKGIFWRFPRKSRTAPRATQGTVLRVAEHVESSPYAGCGRTPHPRHPLGFQVAHGA